MKTWLVKKIHCEDCRYYRDILSKQSFNITKTYDYDKENKIRHLCFSPSEFKENCVSKGGEYLYTNCLIKNKDYDCSEYSKEDEILRQEVEALRKINDANYEQYLRSQEINDRIYENLIPDKRGFFKTIKWIFCKWKINVASVNITLN